LYLTIVVGWLKHWGKVAVRISRLNARVPGAPASVSGPHRCRNIHPVEGGSLLPPAPPLCSFVGR
jgi:hypothetical protein